jgi:hypothetical protein
MGLPAYERLSGDCEFPTFIFPSPPPTPMGRILYALLFLVIVAVLVSGCSQTPAPAATPVPTPDLTLATVPVPEETVPITSSPPAKKQIDISASQSGSDIVIRYTGGVDAADLVSLDIKINNNVQEVVTERENNPVPGQRYVFPHMGTPDPDLVTVNGIFKDGTSQMLLQTKV